MTLEDASCGTLGDVRRLYSLHGLFKPYEADEWDEGHFLQAQTALEAQLAAMVNLLHDLRVTLDGAVVTDPRLVTKNYGATFRKSIPATVRTVTDPTEPLERVAAFF